MRRIALYSDIHGNLPALEAVLADVRSEGIEERYCLGDLVGYGPRPSEVIACVRATGDPCVQGNYDRAVGGRLGDCGRPYATPQEMLDGAESLGFTIADVTATDATLLCRLPREIIIEERDVRIIACHATPKLLAESVMPDAPAARLSSLARDAGAHVVCCGHVHLPFHRAIPSVDGVYHWVNVGSVGRPRDGDSRGAWAELVLGTQEEVLGRTPDDLACRKVGATETWLGVRIHRCAYDIDAVMRDMMARGLPATLAEALKTGSETHSLLVPSSVTARADGVAIGAARVRDREAVVSDVPLAREQLSTCRCPLESRIRVYEALGAIFSGCGDEVATAVRRLRADLRSCRSNPHFDESVITGAFDAADFALRTTKGRVAFEAERERLFGRAKGFSPFSHVLAASELTYQSGDVAENEAALRRTYETAGYEPELSPGLDVGDVTVEALFMAHLLRRASDGDAVATRLARDFFTEHFGEWAVLFAVVTAQQTSEPVMRYAALAMDKYLLCEATMFRRATPDFCGTTRTGQ